MDVLRGAWFVGSRDLLHMLRQKETILWTFIMPFVFFYFIGTVTGGFGGGGDDRPVVLALRVPADAGFLADQIERRLVEQGFTVVRPDDAADPEVAFDRHVRRLEIPARLTERVLAGEKLDVVFRRWGQSLDSEYDSFRVQRAVYTVVADLVAAGETRPPGVASEPVGPDDFARLDAMPRKLRLDVAPAGFRREIPTGFEQTIPGTMVMFTMLILLTSGATTLVVERRLGLLRRLASAPLSRTSVVAGKWGGKLCLGMVQVGFAMLVGRLVFRVAWGDQLPMVLLVMLSYASLLASLGLVLGSLARTEGQAVAVGILSANVLAALGGCWWPIEITPDWMQSLALFLPTGWTMHALHQLVNFGAEASVAIPHVAGMFAGALVLGRIATRLFRFE